MDQNTSVPIPETASSSNEDEVSANFTKALRLLIRAEIRAIIKEQLGKVTEDIMAGER